MNKKVREYLEWQLNNANDSSGKEIITNIIQELEILDILKTIIKTSTICNGIISIDNEINSVRATSFLTKKEYEKIKEWLNDR